MGKSIPIIREREFPLIPVTITHNTLPRYPWKERKQNIQSKTLKISKMVVRRSHHYPQYIAETSLQREKNIQLLLKKWRLFQQLLFIVASDKTCTCVYICKYGHLYK